MWSTEHARLKEHVTSMSGHLEAQIFEGGKFDDSFPPEASLDRLNYIIHDTTGVNLKLM